MDQQPSPTQSSPASTSTFQDLRNQKYDYQIKHKHDVPKYKILYHELAAIIATKALIMGPLERMKIILQVKNLAQFANPKDKPKNALDLANKIGTDQGMFAYYRGMNALIYKLVIQHTLKFGLYETVFQDLKKTHNNPDYQFVNSLVAATVTGVVTTTLTYPLDFAHGRMSADMSKKPSIYIEKAENNKQQARLYNSVRDCLSKAQYEKGLTKSSKLTNIFRGYQSALLGQVPYTIVLMSTFEALEQLNNSQQTKFHSKKDSIPFIYKVFNRFGASTMALVLAQTLCYPFDTVKRRMQLNGSLGHKNIYRSDVDCFRRVLKEEGVVRGLYAGFSVNLVSEGNTPISYQESFKPRFSEPIHLNRDDSQAIPFIKFIQSEGKFELNPEAGEFLQSLKDVKLGVVAVCGKYRTGKSYLLNKLFVETYFQNMNNTTQAFNQAASTTTNRQKQSQEGDFSPLAGHATTEGNSPLNQSQISSLNNKGNNGFQVSPTINPCTKGLWIWKKVIYSDQNECPMIVIDTEGLGAFDEDENHDAKIFLLALLLSSLIIYNSVGTIDENALNNLSLVINLSKKIQLKNRQETPEDIDELASIFPTFLWVLRDFTLKLVDAEGNRISSKQYLENALKEQKGFSETVEQKNRIRRLLKHFFQERDCCTLIRPTEKERDLQDLAKLRDSNLRKDFIDQLNRLKQKVMTKVKVKVVNGHQLNGPMIVELALSYINALNLGQVPNIESAWSNVCNYEQERAFKESLKYFENQVKEKVRNTNEDIGYENIKSVLNQIKEASLQYLKSMFLGEQRMFENFENKLKDELKNQIKLIIKETKLKIDDQINRCIQQVFQESIEDKVRRGVEDLNSLDKVNQEIDHLLTVIQIKFVNDSERVDYLYRKYVQTKIFKVVEILQENDKRQYTMSQRILEEKLKINEGIIERLKNDHKQYQQDSQQQQSKIENERAELFKSQRFMQQKLQNIEEKLSEAKSYLQMYQGKEYRDQHVQTQKLDADDYIQVLNESDSLEQVLNKSVNTSFQNIILQTQEQEQYKLPLTESQFELNRKLYQDILEALNNQSKQISKSMSDEFGEILKNNQSLSQAIESSEKRCLILEKKLEKKSKYESLVKHCQRLQCNGCSKLYTPMLFVSHYVNCKKQQQLRSSIIMENQNPIDPKDDEEREDSQSVIEEQFLAKIVDMKQVLIDLRNGNDSYNSQVHNEFSGNSDELVTIMGGQTLARQQLGHALQGHHINTQQYCSIQFKFCVLFKGNIWYLHRTLVQIKNIMNIIQRDKDNSEQEQCQIAKWLLEIERHEVEENYQRVSELIETFFQTVHRKIIDRKLSMSLKDNQPDYQQEAYKYQFYYEFMEFFEIQQHLQDQANMWGNQIMQNNNDDEVVVQMTYDEQDDDSQNIESGEVNVTTQRRSSVGCINGRLGIPSTISELCSGIQRIQGYGGMTAGGSSAHGHNNHSTIQLDGDKSVNDNNSLHFVSFFSVAEELLMKKNLLESRASHQSNNSRSVGNQGCGAYEGGSEIDEDYHINNNNPRNINNNNSNNNDENFLPGSPEKIQRRNLNQLPFCSISNRPSTIAQQNTQTETKNNFDQQQNNNYINQKSSVLFRKSQSPFSCSKSHLGKSASSVSNNKSANKKCAANGNQNHQITSNKSKMLTNTAKKQQKERGIMHTE